MFTYSFQFLGPQSKSLSLTLDDGKEGVGGRLHLSTARCHMHHLLHGIGHILSMLGLGFPLSIKKTSQNQ